MSETWTKEMLFETKVFSPVLKEIFIELLENGELKSIIDFTYKYRRCYVQVSKYKHWLHKKGLIIFIKDSKCERMVLTEQGKKVVKIFGKLLNELRGLD